MPQGETAGNPSPKPPLVSTAARPHQLPVPVQAVPMLVLVPELALMLALLVPVPEPVLVPELVPEPVPEPVLVPASAAASS